MYFNHIELLEAFYTFTAFNGRFRLDTLRQIVREEMRGKRKTAKKQRAEALLSRSPEGIA